MGLFARWNWTLGAILACLTPSLAAWPQDPPAAPTRARFDEQLDLARRLTREQAWKRAGDAWRDLVVEHAGANYVRPRLAEIRQQWRRVQFFAQARTPKLDELLSGDLVRYEASSGRIELRYTPETLADFTREGNEASFVHPAHFKGPWSATLTGSAREIAGAMLVAGQGEDGQGVRFARYDDKGRLARIHALYTFEGRTPKLAGQSIPKDLAPEGEIQASLRVEDRRVVASYAGGSLFDHARNPGDFGSLVLGVEEPFGVLTLEGAVDPGWISGLLDRATADQRREFDARWVEPAELAAFGPTPSPVGDSRTTEQRMEDLERALGQDDPGRSAFAGLRAALSRRRFSEAIEHLSRVPASDEHRLDLLLLRATLHDAADHTAAAAADYIECARLEPTLAFAHEHAVRALLRQGEPARAADVLRTALETLPDDVGLLRVESMVAQAELGPAWRRVHEERGAFFTVRSEVPGNLCREAVRVLDAAMERCLSEFGALPNGRPARGMVFVFSGQAGYLDYVEDVSDNSAEHTRGLYSVLLKQVIAWNPPEQEQLWDTLRHECVHRYLDLRFGARPRWLDEGLAETLAAGAQPDGAWKSATPRPAWVELLRESTAPIEPFEAWSRADTARFLEDVERNYALSWAWVHFLRFEHPAGRGLMRELLRGLDERLDETVAIERALEGIDLSALNAAFRAFAAGRPR